MTSNGQQTIQMAQGERVTLDCTYTSSPDDVGELDIEWSVVSPDTTKKDHMVRKYVLPEKINESFASLDTALSLF